MAGEFHKIPRKLYAKPETRKESREQKYWKAFQFPTVIKEFSAINHIEYSPVQPYNCLVTSSAKVQIFDYENTIKRNSNRTKENVYGARYRHDGKLMVTGGESGLVQVLDVNSRSILRNLRGHTKPSHVCSFSKEPTKIFSASDDKYVKHWDLPTGAELLTNKIHKDYIRCGCINPTNNDLFITGSYDHKVKVWDTRSNTVVMDMDHGAPIEAILMHQNGSLCLSAGSNYIKVWDVLSGSSTLYQQFSNHQKTITTMCFDGDCKRLLSGGLDRYVKIYDVADYSLVASINYPSPVLAMDLAADGNHLAVGMSDGAISFRHRSKEETKENTNSRKRNFPVQQGSFRYRVRNQDARPDKEDVIIRNKFAPSLTKADRYLRQFRYREALDTTLANTGTFPSAAISLLIELSRRDALDTALGNRDAEGLVDIMKFLTRNITIPRYAPILIPIADLIIEKYSVMVGASKVYDSSLKQLSKRIKEALHPHDDMMKLLGAMDQMFSMMTPPPPTVEKTSLPFNGMNEDDHLLNDSIEVSDDNSKDSDQEVDFFVKHTNGVTKGKNGKSTSILIN